MAHRTWTEKSNTWTVDGVETTDGLTIYESSFPDIAGEPRFIGGDQCSVCGFWWPKDQFRYWNGRAFCRPRGCDGNIKHYQKSGRARTDVLSFEPL